MMKKTSGIALLAAALCCAPIHAETLNDYLPGKLPAAKNVKFAISQDGVLSMTFGEGNEAGARAWMRRYAPMLKPGEKLKISMEVKTTGITDPKAKVGFLVQAMGENHRYLSSRSYPAYFPAALYDNEWKSMEYVFTMPDPTKTPNWQKVAMLMITFEAITSQGVAEFRNFKAEKVADDAAK